MSITTPVITTPATQKYAAALLSLAVSLITALSVVASGPWTLPIILGVIVVFLQGVIGYILPLLDGPWQGGLKVGVSVVLAGVTALIPLLTGTAWTFASTLVVVLAVVNALAQQLGVAIRVTPPEVEALPVSGVQRIGLGDFKPQGGTHVAGATSEHPLPASQDLGRD